MHLPVALSFLLFTPINVHAAIFTGWYTGWHASDVPLASVSWSKYTHMTYAFAATTDDPSNPLLLTPDDEVLLPQFVSAAHEHGVKALLSLGGWAGSRFFSTLVAGEDQRKSLVNATVGLANKFGLDGIDFDWEFPNRQGLGCNAVSPSSSDVPNFLSFLQLLRQDSVGSKLILSAAVPTQPFPLDFTFTEYFASTYFNPSNYSAFPESGNATKSYGSTPKPGPSGYLSSFASALDFIAIMNYDIWNPAVPYAFALTSNNNSDSQVVPRAGPHAALDDTCDMTPESWSNNSSSPSNSNSLLAQHRRRGSAKTAVAAWMDAGFSPDKIVLGVAAYGHAFHVAKENAFASLNDTSSGSSSSSSSPSSISSSTSLFASASSSAVPSAGSTSSDSTFSSSASTASSGSFPSSSSSAALLKIRAPPSTSASTRILAPYPPYTPSLTPIGDKWDSGAGEDACGNHVNAGGIWAFRGLVEGGYLKSDGSEVGQQEDKEGEDSMVYGWDSCGQMPFVYNPSNETLISYDDAKSFAAKGTFISSSSLAGFAMWEVGGDSGDVLIDAIRSAILNGSTAKIQGGNDASAASSIISSFRSWSIGVGIVVGALGLGLVW